MVINPSVKTISAQSLAWEIFRSHHVQDTKVSHWLLFPPSSPQSQYLQIRTQTKEKEEEQKNNIKIQSIHFKLRGMLTVYNS